MSARVGNPQQYTLASQTLGAGTGRVFSFNNPGWATLISIAVLYTATATVGNRVPVFDIKDGAGNVIWRGSLPSGNVTAGQAFRFNIGAGLVTAAPFAAPLVGNIALPDGFALPPLATLTVLDNAAVDNSDTVGGAVIVSN